MMLTLDIPRDRQATFEPQLVGKYQRRLPGFDDHVISMYARGMSCAKSRVICWSCTACRYRPI
jgi:transposase-like protein